MPFKIAELFAEITAPLGRLQADLKKAHSVVAKSTRLMSQSTAIAMRVDTSDLEAGLERARDKAKHVAKDIGRSFALRTAIKRLTGMGNPVQGLIEDTVHHVTIEVAHGTWRASLKAAEATLRGSIRAMVGMAKIPIIVTLVSFKLGLMAAELALVAAVKKMTGWGMIKVAIAVAAFKISLGIVKALLRAAIKTMVRIALIPIRVGLATLRLGLRTATGLVTSAVRHMKRIATVPIRAVTAPLRAIGTFAPMVALGGAAAGIALAVKEASDLNEEVSKAGFVFGEFVRDVTAGAGTMARTLGVPKREFIETASSIGLIGKAAGLSQKDSAALGIRLGKLAADATSFYNVPLEDALTAMRAGLVGESEPMRRFGVLLNEDAVKAEALRLGLTKNARALTEGMKVQARASLIIAGLKDAEGDLVRTQDALANRLREVWGRIRNLAAQIGEYLLPAAKELSRVFAELATNLSGKISSATEMFKGWGESLRRAAGQIGVVFRNFSNFKAILGHLWEDMGKHLGVLWDNFKHNFVELATYFGKLLYEHIYSAVSTALAAALNPTIMSKWGKRMGLAPIVPHRAAAVAAPNLVAPHFQLGAGIAKELKEIRFKENIRGAISLAKEGFARLLGATPKKQPGWAADEKARQRFRAMGVFPEAIPPGQENMTRAQRERIARTRARRHGAHALLGGRVPGLMMSALQNQALGVGPEADEARAKLEDMRRQALTRQARGKGPLAVQAQLALRDFEERQRLVGLMKEGKKAGATEEAKAHGKEAEKALGEMNEAVQDRLMRAIGGEGGGGGGRRTPEFVGIEEFAKRLAVGGEDETPRKQLTQLTQMNEKLGRLLTVGLPGNPVALAAE